MTNFALIYLIRSFFYRIKEFLRHWYLGGFRKITQLLVNTLEALDRWVAFKITLKNLFKPLYQDYSLIGRFFGVIFRFWRLILGAVIYFFVLILFAAIFLIWACIPFYIIYKGYRGW